MTSPVTDHDAAPARADLYLAAADQLLADVVAGARGTWPRACAWLIRLALEEEMTLFWQRACPAVAPSKSQRARLLMLASYADPDTSRRASRAWSALSRAGHHHSYELGLTAAELRLLRADAVAVIAALRSAQPAAPGN